MDFTSVVCFLGQWEGHIILICLTYLICDISIKVERWRFTWIFLDLLEENFGGNRDIFEKGPDGGRL